MQSNKINNFQLVIGLEIHVQLKTNSKLFSNSPVKFTNKQNSQVSFIDAGFPGMLPTFNKKVLELAIIIGLLVKGHINKYSSFDRKNYFYPDLPQGYQISQFQSPIISNGIISINLNNKKKVIKIYRIHIEQDAGKSIHIQKFNKTYIDLNRAGIPLIEIITNPDFNSPEEIISFLNKLKFILKYNNICNCNLEKGAIRCDVNISIKRVGSNKLGNKVEVKNLNSFRNISKAVLIESNRQINLLKNNLNIVQETRLYDNKTNTTKGMRKKEKFQDYRYFPDPDLPPLILHQKIINRIKTSLHEAPKSRYNRYVNNLNITEYNAYIVTRNLDIANFFDKAVKTISPKLVANWLCSEVFGRLNKKKLTFSCLPISSNNFIILLKLIKYNYISGKSAKDVLDKMFIKNENPEIIIKKHKLQQISVYNEIQDFVLQVLNINKSKVKEYISGKNKLFAFFIGQAMKLSRGKINPLRLNKILFDELNKCKNQ